jgi:hypothetical protein
MGESVENKKTVNIQSLKKLVIERFPPSSMVRKIILREKDVITVNAFVQKAEIWLNLVDEEK